MARGKQYNDEIKEKALAMLLTNPDVKAVAEQLKIPSRTLRDWKAAEIIKGGEDNFALLRQEKKAEFITKAWEVIDLATEQVKKTIKEAGPGEAAKVAGIYFDKQALASGDPTNNNNMKLEITLEGELEEWAK